jgi:hypothetical protein
MIGTVILLLLQSTALTYAGAGKPDVAVPRAESEIVVDGRLDDAPWGRAARLTGFHQLQPVDGLPAEEATEVRVLYTARALYFGIIAHARDRAAVNATLSKRDNISNDDRVTIFLDTFNDKRRAFMFGVNALGVQLDGVRSEGAASAGNMFGGSVDYSPDYQFDSRGLVSDSGYVVEIRIPFKSLRFPGSGPQRWGLNIQRDSPAAGKTDIWTDARQATNSFLQQSGTLMGIENIDRGVVTEVQPFFTSTYDGARNASTGDYHYDEPTFKVGANFRLGFPAFSVDATIKPDFSQVEADVGLVTVNERFALFIPEKRPFFLEGIELFSTPSQLVYTRRISSPVAGGKVTGKVGRFGIALLSALDDVRPASGSGSSSHALFNVARVRTDLFGGSALGLTATDRRNGDTTNTVVAGDARLVFRKVYYLESQFGYSTSQRAVSSTTGSALHSSGAPIWKTEFDRTGRLWGFNYALTGAGDRFESSAGFVPRVGIATAHGFNRLAWYGSDHSLVQSVFAFGGPQRAWRYGEMFSGRALEGAENAVVFLTLRGGWGAGASFAHQFFRIDPGFAAGLYERNGTAGLVPYTPPAEVAGLFSDSLGFNTPVFKTFNLGASAARGGTPIFTEGSEGRVVKFSGSAGFRPSQGLRAEGQIVYVRIARDSDRSLYSRTVLPRLKLEYQPLRSLFFRVIGEYRNQSVDAPRSAITGAPLLLSNGDAASSSLIRTLRVDWLISFEPNPGTVAFFGYGSTLDRPEDVGRPFRRDADGFFVKLAYQFRR